MKINFKKIWWGGAGLFCLIIVWGMVFLIINPPRIANQVPRLERILQTEMVKIETKQIRIEKYILSKNTMAKDQALILAKDIKACSRISDISPAIILSLIEQESGFDPNAIGSDGEIGLLQIFPSAWPDSHRGFLAGCEKLIYLNVRENGNLLKVLISYNAGLYRETKIIKNGKKQTFVPGRDFAIQVLRRAEAIENLWGVN